MKVLYKIPVTICIIWLEIEGHLKGDYRDGHDSEFKTPPAQARGPEFPSLWAHKKASQDYMFLLVQSRGKWKLQGWWSWLSARPTPSSVRDSQIRQRVRKKDTQHPPIVASPHNIYTHHTYIYHGQTQQRRGKDMSRHAQGKWVAIIPH